MTDRVCKHTMPARPAVDCFHWQSYGEPSGPMTLGELGQQLSEAEADGVPADAIVFQQDNVIRAEWTRPVAGEVTS